MYGYNSLDILLFSREVSSYKNNVDKKVARDDINPRKLLCNPKNKSV